MELGESPRHGPRFGGEFNVIAAFGAEEGGLAALDTLTGSGVPRSAITVHRPGDAPDCEQVMELGADMADEAGESWAVISGTQVRGAVVAAVALGVVGIALGVIAGLAWDYGFALEPGRVYAVVMAAGVLGLAGATIGLVLGGAGVGRNPADTGEDPEIAERDVLVTVALGDPTAAERTAGLLRGLGAERVHLLDGHGVALPSQAQHPRPADPEGWWWSNAGHG
jgi:hypothetical protein